MPLSILLRQRLKYALTYKEVKLICMQRVVKVPARLVRLRLAGFASAFRGAGFESG